MAKTIVDPKTGQPRPVTELDKNRVRFDWGYHDGAQSVMTGVRRPDGLTVETIREGHFDPVYAEGYIMGCQDYAAGIYDATSEKAWSRAKHLWTGEFAPYQPIGRPPLDFKTKLELAWSAYKSRRWAIAIDVAIVAAIIIALV